MPSFNTLLDAKPATVEIAEDGSVEVHSAGHIWSFSATLEPQSYHEDDDNKMVFRRANGVTYASAFFSGTRIGGEQPVTPDSNRTLASFGKALHAIQAVPKQTPLPASVTAALPGAYAALGLDGRAI